MLFALIALTCDLVDDVHIATVIPPNKDPLNEGHLSIIMVLPHTNALGRVLYYLKLRDTSE